MPDKYLLKQVKELIGNQKPCRYDKLYVFNIAEKFSRLFQIGNKF